MRRRIRFLPGADADLAELDELLTREQGPAVAAAWMDRIFDRIELLSILPGLGRRREQLHGVQLRGSVLKRWLIIVYEDREDENLLVIRRIVSTRRVLYAR
ncbi:type II toxin-antitoxin system RelE/ParE family toxin [Oleomonas cavernae]|uniref:Type II toxin-antitoxin system RelE/ParE family toxin n=1 Tax=Oleomonas cavernae TaxID=2320859 RepID=A0A418WTQ1_9PROT|nr:type II toxin-antitoxin system RelE/ParE family toxin [Oleomonas cavernae]RJF94643.1 type II toxin-antitoxin system RelE/ParE family toxin [Oleomonas cavernae]